MEKIAALVLAAGASSRLGQPKQLLRHDGETLIRRAARAALTAGCSPVVVVVGSLHDRVEQELADLKVHVHYHAQWQRGIGSSLRAGIEHTLLVAPSLDALLVMVCDQPYVTAEILTSLISARAYSQQSAAACAYSGTIGVPAIFDRILFPQLTALPDEHGARHLLSELSRQTTLVPFPDGAVDIDTAAELREHLKFISKAATCAGVDVKTESAAHAEAT